MIKQLIFIILIFALGYMKGIGDTPIKIEEVRLETIKNITEYYANETICTEYEVYNQTINKTMIIPNFQTRIINMTPIQQKDILNIKPKSCHTASCSNGCFQCKYQAMDILGLPRPKFNERESTGYNPLVDKTEYVPIKVDEWGRKYVNLSGQWKQRQTINSLYFYKIGDENIKIERRNETK